MTLNPPTSSADPDQPQPTAPPRQKTLTTGPKIVNLLFRYTRAVVTIIAVCCAAQGLVLIFDQAATTSRAWTAAKSLAPIGVYGVFLLVGALMLFCIRWPRTKNIGYGGAWVSMIVTTFIALTLLVEAGKPNPRGAGLGGAILWVSMAGVLFVSVVALGRSEHQNGTT